MLRFEAQKKVYLLGSRMFDLVRNAYRGYDIQEIALDEMIRLQSLFDSNVTLGVPAGNEVVYLRVLYSSKSMGGVQRPGMHEPIHCSEFGKALLAFLQPLVLEARLKGYDFTRFTERTITNKADFEAELQKVRVNNYSRNDREEYDHFLGIYAPNFNYLRKPIAVLNICHRIQDIRLKT